MFWKGKKRLANSGLGFNVAVHFIIFRSVFPQLFCTSFCFRLSRIQYDDCLNSYSCEIFIYHLPITKIGCIRSETARGK